MYIAFSLLDQFLVFFFDHLSAIPLSGGIAFIAVYRLGMKAAVMVFIVSALLLFSNLTDDHSLSTSLQWSLINTLNAVLGAFLLRMIIGERNPFDDIRSVLIFIGAGASIPFLLTSLGGWFLIDKLHLDVLSGAPNNLLFWWLGGTVGCIVSAPILAVFNILDVVKRKPYETISLLAISAILAATFTGWIDLAGNEFPLQYLIFPLLLWAVFRCDLSVAIVVLLLSLVATMWGSTEGYGAFIRETIVQTSVLLQAFFGVTGATVLMLHAALAERREAEMEVRAAHDELETRVKVRTIDLRKSMREAEEANKVKSRFLAAASHDLRQPIHAISLFSTALQNRVKKGENANLVSKIQSSLGSLGGMLDGLLDMSRIENEAIVPQSHDFSVQEILDEIKTEYEAAATAKNLKLTVVDSSAVLHSDQALLSRIIGNFVTNAIRYTEQGRVLVGCRHYAERLRLEVWDTGRGMSSEDVENVFDPYQRLDGARKHAAEGLGLGLAIADGLAQLLDHPLMVRSKLGAGSLFAIEIPKGELASDFRKIKTPVQTYDEVFHGNTILVVDDDETVLDGMNTVLSDWGCQVVGVSSTGEALDAAQGLGENLDVVISDFHLSADETGIGLLEKMKEGLGRNVPAIIISGDTQPERRREIETAGYFLLTKPIQPVSLRPLLRRQLKRKSA